MKNVKIREGINTKGIFGINILKTLINKAHF